MSDEKRKLNTWDDVMKRHTNAFKQGNKNAGDTKRMKSGFDIMGQAYRDQFAKAAGSTTHPALSGKKIRKTR